MINTGRLAELLGYLYDLKGLQSSLHDMDGREIFTARARSRYCDLLAAAPGGYERCLSCDRHAIQTAVLQKVPFQYRCHAGAIDSAVPVLAGGKAAVVILFGQILDDSPIEEQWLAAKPKVSWYPAQERLKAAFYALPRFSQKEIKACYELINACVSETRLEQLNSPASNQSAQKLEVYIDNHYADPLNIADIASALGMSVSRACALAADIEPGMTIGKMITSKRVTSAMRMLENPKITIREVASRVGVPDYNYFTKVFKKVTGLTPSAWRRLNAIEE